MGQGSGRLELELNGVLLDRRFLLIWREPPGKPEIQEGAGPFLRYFRGLLALA